VSLSLGLIQQGIIIALCVAGGTALLSRLFLPLLQKKLSLFPVRTQATIYLFICSLPLLVATFALVISFLPSIINIVGLGPEHCGLHLDAHSHLCKVHPSLPVSHWLTWLSLIFSVYLLFVFSSVIRDSYRAWSLNRRFNNTSKIQLSSDTWLIESDIPFAFVIGLIKPKVMLSTALKNKLSPAQLNIVLAHENDHKKHHDVLRLIVSRAFSLLHLPSVRKELLAQLSLSTEKACDEAATTQSNNRVAVAETLVIIERLYRDNFGISNSVSLGIGGNTVIERVYSLLNETNNQKTHPSWFIALIAIVTICAALNYNEIHLVVETLLGYITH
jgi:beta-lactamase regulating signal transducer with metallopeptidase domain